MCRTQTCINFCSRNCNCCCRKKVLESQVVKDAATQGMAGIMSIRKDAEETFQDMRENAEEIVIDAHEEDKKEIYIEDEE